MEKAHALAAELHTHFPDTDFDAYALPWTRDALFRILDGVSIVVNTSPLGLHPDDPSPIPAEMIPSRLRVFDNRLPPGRPTDAPLLAAAQVAGARTAGGLSLLLHQGALSFERWFDRPAPLEIMRRALASP